MFTVRLMVAHVQPGFSGVKQSGLGREGSHHSIEEFLEVKYLCWDGLAPAFG
ncbi:acyl-CoA reductase-like NAD-dependent aldehyde dehydrogenase [Variovorax paradoxus]|nr:acyl-CoA reductase-like NAD-dependent aldehyde dehydrogenase [Variovorax paradoxus]